MNKQQEPRLRFHGFTEVWQEKVLGEFVKSLDAGVSVNSEDILPDSDEFSVLKTSCLSSGIFDKNERKRVLSQTEIKRLKEELKDNSILMSRMNTPNLVGLSAYIEKAPKNTFLPDRLWQLKINNEQASTEWLAYYLSKPENLFRIQDNATGTSNSMKNITKNDVFQFEFLAPSLPEQTHLGLFFRRLDSQIAESRAVLEKSRQLKKAMLAKMFPANGEKIPKIRFKGFEGEWECRKLGDLMNVTSVKRIHQSDWTNEGVRFLRARDIVAFNKGEKIEEPLFISKEKYNEYSDISGKVKIGDLLVTGVGTIGVPYLIEDEDPLYFKDGNVIWFQNENKIGGLFFYYSFLNNFIQDFIIETAGIGTVGTYTIDTGKKTPIFLPPTKSEQTAIGNFFRQLDETIALQSAEVEKLNQLKKGLLAAMLV